MPNVKKPANAAKTCDPCQTIVCGVEAISQDLCSYTEKAYSAGDQAIWEGCVVESLVDQAPDPAAQDGDTWVDLKSPDSEKQWRKLGGVKDLFAALGDGCALTTPKATDCDLVKEGEWRCHDGCFRQAKRDVYLQADADGNLNMPGADEPANADWSKCWGAEDLLNLLNDPKGIREIDDSDPDATTITLNDGTVISSPEQEDRDTRLTNPRLNAAGTAYIWDVIDADGNVVGTETQQIPNVLSKCGGEPVDGELVQCDQFEDLLGAALPETCFETEGVSGSCGDISPVGLVSDGTNCGKFISISEADIRIIRASYSSNGDGSLPHPFPTDRTDDTTRYSYPDLVTDHGAGTIDATKLANNLLFCVDVEILCAGSYNFRSSATPVHTQFPELTGKSRMVFSVGGDLLTNAASGAVRAARNFLSTEGEYSDDAFPVTLSAGTHTVCMYLVKSVADANWPFCQVGTLGSPTLQIDRVIR